MNTLKAISLASKNKYFLVNHFHELKKYLYEPDSQTLLNIINYCHEKSIPINETTINIIKSELQITNQNTIYLLTRIINIENDLPEELLLDSIKNDFIKHNTEVFHQSIADKLKKDTVDKTDVVATINTFLANISEMFNEGVDIHEAFDKYTEAIDMHTNIIESGFKSIDMPLFGFKKKDNYVIAGDTGIGKTVMLLQLAFSLSRIGYNVGFYSLEMGWEELLERIVASMVGKSLNVFKTNPNLKNRYKEIMLRAKSLLSEDIKLTIHDDLFSFVDIKASIRQNNYDIVFIDYWQLLEHGDTSKNFNNRQTELSEISREAKRFSKETLIPIVWGAQLVSKQVKMSPNYFPDKSHLRDSTSIANDSAATILLYRPEYYGINKFNGEDTAGKAWVIYDKNRHGLCTMIKTLFFGDKMLFVDIQEEINEFKKKVANNSGQKYQKPDVEEQDIE